MPGNAGGAKGPDFWCAFEDGEVVVIGDEPANTINDRRVDIRSLSPSGGTAFGRSQSRGFRDCYWFAAQLGSKMNAFVFQVICVCAVRRFLLRADFVAKG